MKTLGNSRLSQKFQITIPKEVRSHLNLSAGDLIIFINNQNEVLLKPGEVRIKK